MTSYIKLFFFTSFPFVLKSLKHSPSSLSVYYSVSMILYTFNVIKYDYYLGLGLNFNPKVVICGIMRYFFENFFLGFIGFDLYARDFSV